MDRGDNVGQWTAKLKEVHVLKSRNSNVLKEIRENGKDFVFQTLYLNLIIRSDLHKSCFKF